MFTDFEKPIGLSNHEIQFKKLPKYGFFEKYSNLCTMLFQVFINDFKPFVYR